MKGIQKVQCKAEKKKRKEFMEGILSQGIALPKEKYLSAQRY